MSEKPNKDRIAKIDEQRGKLHKRHGQGERKSAVSGTSLDGSSLINVDYWYATFDSYNQTLEVKAFVSGNSDSIDDVTIDAWKDGSFLMDAHAFQLEPDVSSMFISATRGDASNPSRVLSYLSGAVTKDGKAELFSYYRYLDVAAPLAAKKATGAQ